VIGANVLPATGAVRIAIARQSIEVERIGIDPLITVLRTWPFGRGATMRLANLTGSIAIRDWQAEPLANAIVTAIDEARPEPGGRLMAEPARTGERMSVREQHARLAQLEAVPRAQLTLPERAEFELLDRRRDQRRRYKEDIAA
jgi:hypothetical protein